MAILVAVKVLGNGEMTGQGAVVEALLCAHGKGIDRGELLPPGLWLVRLKGSDRNTCVMAFEDMPQHWQEQICYHQRVGDKRLGYDIG